MAPPAPLQCQAPDCDYETPPNTPTWDQMMMLMTQHIQLQHPAPVQQQHACHTGSRLEKLPRPVFTLNMSEAAWDFKVIEWDSYIAQTLVTDNTKLLQLRASCSEELRSRVYDSGDFASLNTVDLLLARMKELAVVTPLDYLGKGNFFL